MPRGRLSKAFRTTLQGFSFVALCVAGVMAALIFGGHICCALGGGAGNFPWMPKSAWPLMAIGSSYLALICTVDRTPAQRLLGFFVGTAFILWGVEQFLPSPALVALIDDAVVFLFVLDLGIVIRENLRRSPARR